MRRVQSPLALLVLVFLSSACSKPEPSNASAAETSGAESRASRPSESATGSPSVAVGEPDPATAIPAAPTLRMISQGEEPRHALRYRFSLNQREAARMVLNTHLSMRIGEMAAPEVNAPPIHSRLQIQPVEITPEGNLRYTFRIASIEVVAEPDSNPEVVAAMQRELAHVENAGGQALVTPRGVTLEARFEPPSNATPQVLQMLDNMQQTIRLLSAPFPEEPVGRGAQWELTTPVTTGSMRYAQRTTYTLSALSPETGTLDVRVAQTAPRQRLAMGGLPPGVTVSLESLSSSGTGIQQFELSRVVPSSELRVQMQMHAVAEGNDGRQPIATNLRMHAKIEPVE